MHSLGIGIGLNCVFIDRGGLKKNPEKGQKMKNIFLFVLNKSQSVIHVILNKNFQGIFKNIIFRSVALVTKKLWDIL